MKKNNDIFYDLFRFGDGISYLYFIKKYRYDVGFKYMVYWRLALKTNKILRKYCIWKLRNISFKTGIEIPLTASIGKGIRMIHPYNITINSKAIIGKNFTILKGATIGNIKSGSKKGAPYIGNNVYVGLNSTIVGNIRIGDNVLIASNSFVNQDIPSDSLVIGNPVRIISNNNATKHYVENRINE